MFGLEAIVSEVQVVAVHLRTPVWLLVLCAGRGCRAEEHTCWLVPGDNFGVSATTLIRRRCNVHRVLRKK